VRPAESRTAFLRFIGVKEVMLDGLLLPWLLRIKPLLASLARRD
jgi:hypothetical protein